MGFRMSNAADYVKSILTRVSRMISFRKGIAGNESFRVVFDLFREVLESNNRSLEVITDMGEKLGGDYLFDVTYVKRAYAELRAGIERSILNFDLLTVTRYPRLRGAFDRIDALITGMLYDVPPSLRKMVVFFEDIDWDMLRDVGGKNAHLSEVKKQLKLAVPDAFVITTHAFDEFVRHNGLQEKIATLTGGVADESELKRIQESIIEGDIPAGLDIALSEAIDTMRERKDDCLLAVRSSAEEEDSSSSFAGQFETILNVPLEADAIKDAYKRVVSSLYSEKATAYQRHLGYEIGRMKMAVGCMVMVDALTSGVIYSSSPKGNGNVLMISATWGLGKSLVEGQTDADLYTVQKESSPELVAAKYGKKEYMLITAREGGIREVRTPGDLEMKPCLTPEQVSELSIQAMRIEKYFGSPRDVEWAIGGDGSIYILQARPLHLPDTRSSSRGRETEIDSGYPVLFRDRGIVVQKGAAAGRVFVVRQSDELDHLPKGCVLVARHDSSLLVRVMPFVSAIVTETGTPTSHMAALCREFRVPTVVNAGSAVQLLTQGKEITVSAGDDDSVAVYEGIIGEILTKAHQDSLRMEDIHEFRKKRYILRYVSPLNLIDPLMEEFTPEGCKTMHDILRFIHEKAVAELVESARRESTRLKGSGNVIKLQIPVPAGILIMDMGGGLDILRTDKKATFEQITSVPLRAIIKGLLHPGVWQSEAVALRVNDFLSSMMRMPDIVSDSERHAGYNVAVVSREYMNLSLGFGYHFTMLDCYCSEYAKNNHIYFRFVGGATDIVKRSRRVELIAMILREYGFSVKTKGDLIVTRLTNIGQDEMECILDQIGRLIAFTRQLDALLRDDPSVEYYAQRFLRGEYDF